MDGGNRTVHVNQNGHNQPEEQNWLYRTRTRMDENLLKTGDLSLTLSWPTDEDEKTYICSVYSRKGDVLMEKQVWLKVKVQQVEVESGTASVLLPLKVPRFPWFCIFRLQVDKVEWRDRDNRKVHVNQNGHNQPEEQNHLYRTRTRVDENLLKTGDLSLTLRRPTGGDKNLYTCRVYSRKGDVLMMKQVQLKVKGQWFKCISRDQPEEMFGPEPVPPLFELDQFWLSLIDYLTLTCNWFCNI
ncbi:uncharacterized protein LOC103131976 [Poecilia formosa]|uniref:uncharacterized protein LOC103131976 n=1 Tax=Poecilia formosa TaxID=48698 RepID=UPI0007BA8EE1|nr:PREDICTED: uncharacterized protein LOC103131976 [Poecilia formosa]